MIRGFYPGVWDLLHVGHLAALRYACGRCDSLIVGVPSDDIVEEDKGFPPTIPHQERIDMILAVKWVDRVFPYYRLEFVSCMETVHPGVLFIGDTWGTKERHVDATEWMKESGGLLVQVPYYRHQSSTKIKGAIRGRTTST